MPENEGKLSFQPVCEEPIQNMVQSTMRGWCKDRP